MNKNEFKGFLRDYLGKAKYLQVNYNTSIFKFEDPCPCYVIIDGYPYCATNYADLAKEIFDDEELALGVIEYNPERIAEPGSINSKFQDDKEFIEKAVYYNYEVLSYVDKKYRNSKSLIRKLVKSSDGDAFKYASDELKRDATFVKLLLNTPRRGANCYREKISDRTPIAKKIVSFMSPELLKDKDVVLDIVPYFVPDGIDASLLEDEDFMVKATGFNDRMIDLIPAKFRGNKDFFLKISKSFPGKIFFSNEYVKELLKDRDFAFGLVETNPENLWDMPKKYYDDEDIVLEAMKTDLTAVRDASSRLKNDKEFMLAAIREEADAFQYASAKLRNDKEVVLAAIDKDTELARCIGKKLADDDYFIYDLIKKDPPSIQYASDRLRDDFDMVMEAVKRMNFCDCYFLNSISDRLKDDEDIITEAMKRDGHALEYASDRLKEVLKQ